MAVEPLFCDSMDTLKAKLRMSGTTDTDSLAVIDQIVSEVRLGFYSKITRERAQYIASLPLVDNPSTDDEVLKSIGATTEVVWCLYLLGLRLPFAVIQANSKMLDRFNEEEAFRVGELPKAYLLELKRQVDSGMAFLKVPVSDSPYPQKTALITNPNNRGIFADGWGGMSHGHRPPVRETKQGIDQKARQALNDLANAVSAIPDIPDVYQDKTVKNTVNDLIDAVKESI